MSRVNLNDILLRANDAARRRNAPPLVLPGYAGLRGLAEMGKKPNKPRAPGGSDEVAAKPTKDSIAAWKLYIDRLQDILSGLRSGKYLPSVAIPLAPNVTGKPEQYRTAANLRDNLIPAARARATYTANTPRPMTAQQQAEADAKAAADARSAAEAAAAAQAAANAAAAAAAAQAAADAQAAANAGTTTDTGTTNITVSSNGTPVPTNAGTTTVDPVTGAIVPVASTSTAGGIMSNKWTWIALAAGVGLYLWKRKGGRR